MTGGHLSYLPPLCSPPSPNVASLARSRTQEETCFLLGSPLWRLQTAGSRRKQEPCCTGALPRPLLADHRVLGRGLGISTTACLLGEQTLSKLPPHRFLLEPQRLRDGFRPAGWMDESSGHLRDLLLAHPDGDHPVGTPWPGFPLPGEQPPRGVPGEAHRPVVFWGAGVVLLEQDEPPTHCCCPLLAHLDRLCPRRRL